MTNVTSMNDFIRKTRTDPTELSLAELDAALDTCSKLWAQAVRQLEQDGNDYDAFVDKAALDTRLANLQAQFDAKIGRSA